MILSFSTGVEGRVKEATGLSKKKLEVLHVITNILSNDYEIFIPQILRGASNSSKMGWLRNISRDFKHKPLISDSVNCTFLPGLEPRTVEIRIFFFTNRSTRSSTAVKTNLQAKSQEHSIYFSKSKYFIKLSFNNKSQLK